MDLIVPRPEEPLLFPPGAFYVDPWRPVSRAVITHGHSDHARRGNEAYLCQHDSVPILLRRLGDAAVQGVDYGETIDRNGVKVSLHPAGHILGSAQISPGVSRRGLARFRRLQARGGRNLLGFRAGALRHVHHQIDVRPADLPLAAAGQDT